MISPHTKSFEATKADLDEAVSGYVTAKNSADEARRKETDARNRLNEKQKAFDEAVSAIRADAPYDTDWSRGRHHGEVPR